jgi:hypothetical protein
MHLLLTAALAGTMPPGEEIERALAIHLTNTGLRHVGDAIEGLVPAGIPIKDISGSVECDADADPLTYALDETELVLRAEDVEIAASDGRLDITLYLSIQSDPADLSVQGDCSFLVDLDETCVLEFPTTSAVAHIGMALALAEHPDGTPYVDATVEDPTLEISPIGNPLADCTLADAISFILVDDPENITNIVMGLVEPELDGLGAELELTVEDALAALIIETSFSLGEAELALELYPTLLDLDDAGLALGLGGTVRPSFLSDCVPESQGSEFSGADWPAFSETAWDSSLEYDAALFLNKDYVDHLLWNVYAAGGLCLDVGELGGIDLTTELFASMFGEEFSELFDEPQTLGLVTNPNHPPEMLWSHDGAPMRLLLEEFGLDFSANLNDRMTRLFQVAITTEVGIEPGLTSDSFAPELVFDTEGIEYSEPYNELLEPGFGEGLDSFIPTVLDGFLPADLLPVIAIPSFYGIGVDTVFWIPDEEQVWQGGFILLDVANVEPLEVPGCEGGDPLGCSGEGGGIDFETALGCGEDGGCGDQGCSSDSGCEDTGCATHKGKARIVIPGRIWMLVFFVAMIRLRRRP